MKRMVYLITGLCSLGLGTLGTLLPILPTVPFYLLAVYCFARSSEQLHHWFVSSGLYRKNLESFAKREGLTRKVKAKILITISLSIALSLCLTAGILIAQGILVMVWFGLMLYFLVKVKTVK